MGEQARTSQCQAGKGAEREEGVEPAFCRTPLTCGTFCCGKKQLWIHSEGCVTSRPSLCPIWTPLRAALGPAGCGAYPGTFFISTTISR